ncbi:hypothetical protein VX159_08175 [Dechloromonas sp. ZY10]|uniref:hypothetical protein n=1 Tax=Dechloromonas aquae TaxID=2664436 RepID=UPI0035289548
MTPVTQKVNVACELLECALRLYYEEGSDFAALHLAGAAEELLGMQVERIGGKSEFSALKDGALRISPAIRDAYFNGKGNTPTKKTMAKAINHAKNATKHMDPSDVDYVAFNARAEARKILERAVHNFQEVYSEMIEVEIKETELIRRFLLSHGA